MLAGAGLFSAAVAAKSEACSLVASLRPIDFSDEACRRSLRRLVDLINAAPALADAEVVKRAGRLGVRFDDDVTDAVLGFAKTRPVEDLDLIRAWSMSAGKRDRAPLVIREINQLKGERGIALYQFTLRRDQYHPELKLEDVNGGGCDGPHHAFYAPEDSSYLGLFRNNRLRAVSAFDVWLMEP